MSGPTTVLFMTSDPLFVLLAASMIRAQQAILSAQLLAEQVQETNQERKDALLQALAGSASAEWQAMRDRQQQAESAAEQLLVLAREMGCQSQIECCIPARPATEDLPAMAAYTRELEALSEQLRPVLMQESMRRAAKESLQEADLETVAAAIPPATLVQRLLARLAHLPAIPERITALANELQACLPGARAEALATELRLQIQAELQADLDQQLQQAQALIVEQSLKDLGYQVEEIAETLFVDGGVVHFRRSGWGDYMVRMRLDSKSRSANFNVIRAVEEGENERSVLDHIAEDRWCSEFPALMKTLEARGIQLQITRRLEAGELPVQLVNRDKLPHFSEDQQTQPHQVKTLRT